MYIANFEFILTAVVLLTGLGALIDQLAFAGKRKRLGKKPSGLFGFCRSYFPVLLAVLLIRSFVFQPYRVVSGSLEPTVLVGDLVFVNQFAYGLRLPVLHTKIAKVGEPKIGDIALFYSPVYKDQVWVKRVIGTPGDHIVYKNKVLTVNGKVANQRLLGTGFDTEPNMAPRFMIKKEEDLNGIKHQIYVAQHYDESGDFDVTVPKGEYFLMGDNRDDSDDSRMWGFLPEKNLIGKAELILFSWNSVTHRPRWTRMGGGFRVA